MKMSRFSNIFGALGENTWRCALCAGIYPLQNTYIRKVKILKAPKFDLLKLMDVHGDYSEEVRGALFFLGYMPADFCSLVCQRITHAALPREQTFDLTIHIVNNVYRWAPSWRGLLRPLPPLRRLHRQAF